MTRTTTYEEEFFSATTPRAPLTGLGAGQYSHRPPTLSASLLSEGRGKYSKGHAQPVRNLSGGNICTSLLRGEARSDSVTLSPAPCYYYNTEQMNDGENPPINDRLLLYRDFRRYSDQREVPKHGDYNPSPPTPLSPSNVKPEMVDMATQVDEGAGPEGEVENEAAVIEEDDRKIVHGYYCIPSTTSDDSAPPTASRDIDHAQPLSLTTPTSNNDHAHPHPPYNSDNDCNYYKPRSVESTRRMNELFQGFKRCEVLRRFHSAYPESAPDLRQYGTRTGKRHIINGHHAYYFH